MSIHTILSQMEEEFDKKFVIRTGTKKIKRVGYYCTKDSDSHVGHDPKLILDFMRSFATRIVEEAQREERERIKDLHNYSNLDVPELDLKLDITVTPHIYAMKMEDKIKADILTSKLKYWLLVHIDELEKEMRTKLQKMKI